MPNRQEAVLLAGMAFDWLRRMLGATPTLALVSNVLGASLESVSRQLSQAGVNHALIGGIAVAVHGFRRATFDLDLLVDDAKEPTVNDIMLGLGFTNIQRSKVFSNYALGRLRVDFMRTQGQHTQDMLVRAETKQVGNVSIRVVRPEDIVGLKLQALENNPSRTKDLIDIQELVRMGHKTMDMALVREYFVLFGKEAQLDGILKAL